jgi:hypothetical protein
MQQLTDGVAAVAYKDTSDRGLWEESNDFSYLERDSFAWPANLALRASYFLSSKAP